MPRTKAKPVKKTKPRVRRIPLPPGVLTARMAAEKIGCSRELVNKLAQAGTLKHYKAGRDNRFRLEDVEAYMKGTAA